MVDKGRKVIAAKLGRHRRMEAYTAALLFFLQNTNQNQVSHVIYFIEYKQLQY
ncbi:hypothetical protein D3C73_647080 [compost metagenome]